MTSQLKDSGKFIKKNSIIEAQKIKCDLHPNELIQFLSPLNKEGQLFKCIKCIAQNKEYELLLLLEQIMNENEKDLIYNWPLLNDHQQLLKKIENQIQFKYETLQTRIQAFYKNLKIKFLEIIQNQEQDSLSCISQFPENNRNLLKLYNELSQRTQLKYLMNQQNISKVEKEGQIKQIISNVINSQVEIQNELQIMILKQQTFLNSTTPQNLNHIQESFLNQLKNMNLFIVEDELLNILKKQKNEKQQDQINIQRIIVNETIKNFVNCYSKNYQIFQESLKKQLKQLEQLSSKHNSILDSLINSLPTSKLLAIKLEEDCKLIKTEYLTSSQLEIVEETNTINKLGQIPGTAVFANNLDNECTYIINCVFNAPLNGFFELGIGLIEEAQINKQGVGQTVPKSVFRSKANSEVYSIIKGESLNCNRLNKQISQIEVRICIATQECYFCDLKHLNIIKTDPSLIFKNGKYRFGITSYYSNKAIVSITISSVWKFYNQNMVSSFC